MRQSDNKKSNNIIINSIEKKNQFLKLVPEFVLEKNYKEQAYFVYRYILNNGVIGNIKYYDLDSVLNELEEEKINQIITELKEFKIKESIYFTMKKILEDEEYFSDTLDEIHDHLMSVMFTKLANMDYS